MGLIRGWVCQASTVEVQIDGGEWQRVAYGTTRKDTIGVCGDDNNGFGYTFNWNALGTGSHTLQAFADGMEFANVTFTITTLGQEYLRGASGTYMLSNFPIPNQNIVVRWQESNQNFVIIDSSLRREAESASTCSGCSIVPRSKASNKTVLHLNNAGDKADYDIQVPVTGNYKLIVRYSNDDTGVGDDISVLVNGEKRSEFHTQNTRPINGNWGNGWNIFTDSPVIYLGGIPNELPPVISIKLVSTDGYGVDLDLFWLIPEF